MCGKEKQDARTKRKLGISVQMAVEVRVQKVIIYRCEANISQKTGAVCRNAHDSTLQKEAKKYTQGFWIWFMKIGEFITCFMKNINILS